MMNGAPKGAEGAHRKHESERLMPDTLMSVAQQLDAKRFQVIENGHAVTVEIENAPKEFDGMFLFRPEGVKKVRHKDGKEVLIRYGHIVEDARKWFGETPLTDHTPREIKDRLRTEIGALVDAPRAPERRERKLAPELTTPRFITGVVVQEDAGSYLAVDKTGYDRRVREHVPERADVSANVAPGQLVVLRAEVIQGEVQWVYHTTCGELGDSRAEVLALAYRSGTDPEFPFEVEQQIETLRSRYHQEGDRTFMEREATTFIDNEGKERRGSLVLEKEAYRHGEHRLDLRDREDIDIFTIDPESAKDFDDAISYREVMRGGKKVYEIGIHIADVAHFARLGSALEQDARLRQFTRYLKQITVPMLPEFVSNTLCSLEPHKDRLAFSTIFTFNEDGSFADEPWFGRALIRSKHRFTYKGADEAMADNNDERGGRLRNLQRFTTKLRENRKGRGAISFDQRPEAEIEYDKSNRAVAIRPKVRQETSLLIEDLMLAANEAQGEYLADPSGGESKLLLRAHRTPNLSRVIEIAERVIGWDPENKNNAELVDALEAFNIAMSIKDEEKRGVAIENLERTDLIPRLVNNIRRRESEGDPRFREVIKTLITRLLGSAHYTTEREEHFSLAVEPYLHATSPIRRYPDLIVQYLMDEKLRNRQGVSGVNDMSLEFLNEIADRANIARMQSRRAEQDALEVAFLDVVEKSGKGARFSGRNAVVVGVGREGVRVALTLVGGYKHAIEVPWEYFNGVHLDDEGRRVYRFRRRDGSQGEIDAFRKFGPSREGYRTLLMVVRKVDRQNRRVIFSIQDEDRVSEEELANPAKGRKAAAKPVPAPRAPKTTQGAGKRKPRAATGTAAKTTSRPPRKPRTKS